MTVVFFLSEVKVYNDNLLELLLPFSPRNVELTKFIATK